MTNVLLLGAGTIGRMIAALLTQSGDYRVRVGDTDVTALEHMQFVMKEGQVYRGLAVQCAAAPSAWPCEAPAK